MSNYIKNIRKEIGHQKLMHPAARILVENEKGEFLFVKKTNNGKLGIPAGGLDPNETIEQCIKREVKEETGIEIVELKVVGISSNPKSETITYPNGDVVQYFTVEFYSNSFRGDLQVTDTEEIIKAEFLDKSYLKLLPKSEISVVESLEYFRMHGQIMVK